MCHQSVGLVQSVIERSGIPTASVSLLKEVTGRVNPPRALVVHGPLGYPLGNPFQKARQTLILRDLLSMLARPAGFIREFAELS